LQRGDIGWRLIRALAHARYRIRFARIWGEESTA
jgi:hypothetical protein